MRVTYSYQFVTQSIVSKATVGYETVHIHIACISGLNISLVVLVSGSTSEDRSSDEHKAAAPSGTEATRGNGRGAHRGRGSDKGRGSVSGRGGG